MVEPVEELSELSFNTGWTAENIIELFDAINELQYVIYYGIGAIFGIIALLLVLIFFVSFKK